MEEDSFSKALKIFEVSSSTPFILRCLTRVDVFNVEYSNFHENNAKIANEEVEEFEISHTKCSSTFILFEKKFYKHRKKKTIHFFEVLFVLFFKHFVISITT